jgi:hypothetical protein
MNATTANTYRVVTVELLRRTYEVTTPGDEARAVELAEQGDYGAPVEERVELLDDVVCDCSIIEVICESTTDSEHAATDAAEGST